jgi:peroxiredoxin
MLAYRHRLSHPPKPRKENFGISSIQLPGNLILACILIFTAGIATTQAAEEDKSSARGGLQTLNAVPDTPPAPDFTLTDTRGKTHSLSDYRGKSVIVNFWAVWCAPCRKEMPAMQRAWEQTRDRGVMMLAVNWGDKAEAVDTFLEKIPVDFPVLLGGDKDMTAEWGVRGLPTTFVVDPEGRLAYRVDGERDWDEPELMEKVLELGGK